MVEKREIELLKEYLKKNSDVLLAFLFGSFAKKREMAESDIDIGIYLKDKTKSGKISKKVGEIIGREVDLIFLDEAPATLISSILKTGIPLVIRDRNLYLDLYLKKTTEAEDFYQFAKSFFEISQRAKSLAEEDKFRLMERFQFLKNEVREIEKFQTLTLKEYLEDKQKCWMVERWTENILNATIDIAKLVLAGEKKEMVRTYEEALIHFGILISLDEKEADHFSQFAKLRNILAHEYLDILYKKIQDFIQKYPLFYQKISNFLENYLK